MQEEEKWQRKIEKEQMIRQDRVPRKEETDPVRNYQLKRKKYEEKKDAEKSAADWI